MLNALPGGSGAAAIKAEVPAAIGFRLPSRTNPPLSFAALDPSLTFKIHSQLRLNDQHRHKRRMLHHPRTLFSAGSLDCAFQSLWVVELSRFLSLIVHGREIG
jgi:hypothetical protein